jgi:hypothetical protein
MAMVNVRPFRPDEIDDFVAAGNGNYHRNEVKQYLEDMLEKGSVRREWCFVLEEAGHVNTGGNPVDLTGTARIRLLVFYRFHRLPKQQRCPVNPPAVCLSKVGLASRSLDHA